MDNPENCLDDLDYEYIKSIQKPELEKKAYLKNLEKKFWPLHLYN